MTTERIEVNKNWSLIQNLDVDTSYYIQASLNNIYLYEGNSIPDNDERYLGIFIKENEGINFVKTALDLYVRTNSNNGFINISDNIGVISSSGGGGLTLNQIRNAGGILEYDSNYTYSEEQIIYNNGQTFISKIDNNQGNTPPTDNTLNANWGFLSKVIEWVQDVTYNKDDYILYENRLYKCKESFNSSTPPPLYGSNNNLELVNVGTKAGTLSVEHTNYNNDPVDGVNELTAGYDGLLRGNSLLSTREDSGAFKYLIDRNYLINNKVIDDLDNLTYVALTNNVGEQPSTDNGTNWVLETQITQVLNVQKLSDQSAIGNNQYDLITYPDTSSTDGSIEMLNNELVVNKSQNYLIYMTFNTGKTGGNSGTHAISSEKNGGGKEDAIACSLGNDDITQTKSFLITGYLQKDDIIEIFMNRTEGNDMQLTYDTTTEPDTPASKINVYNISKQSASLLQDELKNKKNFEIIKVENKKKKSGFETKEIFVITKELIEKHPVLKQITK